MILIISIEQDESTIDITRWLYHLQKKFIVIKDKDFIDSVRIHVNTSEVFIKYKDITIHFNEITSVWYRRGNFVIKDSFLKEGFVEDKIGAFLDKEKKELFEYLHFLLDQKFAINNYNHKKVNKLIVLTLAKQLGLQIPETFVTNRKKDVITTMKEFSVVTKPINNPIGFYGDTYWLPTYTTEVTEESVNAVNDWFGASLFQENIIKVLEIRSYFLEGDFYSMAIFSQSDEQTKTDFRCYNHQKPNRTIPFKLPQNIEDKLKPLAQKLNLNSCSFDLIYTPEKEYVFLEVNPIGQFGMVSYPCNYYLEEKIAQKLKDYDLTG